jgi:endoglucanase
MHHRPSLKARKGYVPGILLVFVLAIAACGNGGTGENSPVAASGGAGQGGSVGSAAGASSVGGAVSSGGALGVGGSPAGDAAFATDASEAPVDIGSGGASAAGGATGGASGGKGGAADDVDAAAMAKAMGFGTNIGNTFDNTTSWETGWGQPLVTQAYVQGMASRGIKTVRVPVAWDTYAHNGVIDSTKLGRVKEVVGWILAAGMYAIVNIHWDGGWIFNENKATVYTLTDDVKSKFASYWKQIASGFGDVGHALIFEGLNEEAQFYVGGNQNGTPDIGALNQLNQLFVTTIRAQAGYNASRALLIAGFATDINKTCVDAFAVPTDPAGEGRLFLSIHYYDPYPFTLMEDPASWGSPAGTWGTDAEKQALADQFSKLGTFSTNKHIPIILGEFAVTRGQKVVRQPASRSLWMQSVAKAMMSHGGVPVLWDTGSEISRKDGSFSAELQAVMTSLK